jgi:hypothetical protein
MRVVGAGSHALGVCSCVTSVARYSFNLPLPGAGSDALSVRSSVTLVPRRSLGLPLPLPSAADRAGNHVPVVAVMGTSVGCDIAVR